jgi:tRNA wybutosine-synthesizing protein 2
VAQSFKTTHVALNAPIPPSLPALPNAHSASASISTSTSSASNTQRSPANLTPLHGDFGPGAPLPRPSPADLAAALWVTARQHGIWQTWPPRHCMFARGNVSEKARLQQLVRRQLDTQPLPGADADAAQVLLLEPPAMAAVDLYAGIGYFAFAYVAGGVAPVLCWEMNAWSVEGLRRGAALNGWAVETVERKQERPATDGADKADEALARRVADKKLVMFYMDNVEAAPVIERLRATLPPVRHVNCGLLPSSRGSWRTAVAALDPVLGGWVHVHENFHEQQIDQLAEEVLREFKSIVEEMSATGKITTKRVTLDHLEKVKTYAPRVIHCVLDISILA